MAQGQTPGNGRTSPYGNGRGGSASVSGGGNDFVRNPGGNPTPGPRPRDYTLSQVGPQQRGGPGPNPASVPSGGTYPFTPPQGDSANVLGPGTPGVRPPFRLSGG